MTGNRALLETQECKIASEFGPGQDELETLCIRELHKAECEFAAGETDGAVIYCKAMMAAQTEDAAAIA